MANTQMPGFHPVAHAGETVELFRSRVDSNNTTAIFKGDALDWTTAATIVTATTNAAIYSVQWGGASYMSSGQRIERKYLPAATTYTGTGVEPVDASYVYAVEDMVNTKFHATCDEALTLAVENLNFVMVLGTGSTTSGWSGHELDATGAATTATFPWRLLHLVIGDPKSDPTLADAKCLIQANATRRASAIEIGGALGTA